MNGLFFANPVGLLGLAALAGVIALYLFRRRYRPLSVTGLFLWGREKRVMEGGRRIEKRVRGRSFWLDSAAAVLLGLALAGPGWRDGKRPVAVILDDCFAMRARNGSAVARTEGGRLLAGASNSGRETAVLLAGEQPRLLCGMERRSGAEAEKVMAAYAPAAGRSNLSSAVLRARELWGDVAEIHIFTNQDVTADVLAGGRGGVVHRLAGRGGNIAFSQVWRTGSDGAPGHERVVLAGRNYSFSPASVDLRMATHVEINPRQLYHETLELAAGEQFSREIDLDAVSGETVRASLEAARDVLADDSLAFLPPRPGEAVTYGLSGLSPEAALHIGRAFEAAGLRRDDSLPDVMAVSGTDAKGAVVTLEILPADQPGVVTPPYLVDHASPLCVDLDLSPALWVAASPRRPQRTAGILIDAGGLPLYWSGGRGRFHMNMAVERCPLVNEPAWPILFANLTEHCRTLLPGLRQSVYRPGEALRYNSHPDSKDDVALFRDGVEVASGSVVLSGEPGVYEVRQGNEQVGYVAVAPVFVSASDTRALAESDGVFRGEGVDAIGPGSVDLSAWCLVLGVVALCTNWWLMKR